MHSPLLPLSPCLLLLLASAPTLARDDASPGPGLTTTPSRGIGAEQWVYVGTYTSGKSEGIYAFRFDLDSGKLTPVGVTKGVKNPSFLAIHPNHKYLYAVSEVSDAGGKQAGGVSAFAIDRSTAVLRPLNSQLSEGAGPCHLVVDRTGQVVLVANYGGGSVAALPLDDHGNLRPASAAIQHEGSGVNQQRQSGPHAHSINVDPTNHYAMAADLGLDKVLIYKLNPDRGTLEPNDPSSVSVAPGAGPRHFAFHPNGRFAYVINEMLCTVTAFAYDSERGTLKEIQTIATLPGNGEVKKGYSTAEVQVHPSGKFLYGSNRGHDSIAIFTIDPATGRLTATGHQSTGGKTPRNFGIDPSGRFLLAANQDSGTIVVFRINPGNGELMTTGQLVEVPNPVCVKFLEP